MANRPHMNLAIFKSQEVAVSERCNESW